MPRRSETTRDNLRRLRTQRRLSLRALSERIADLDEQMAVSTLSDIENGRRRIDVDDLDLLARVLQVDPVELLLTPDELTRLAWLYQAEPMARLEQLVEQQLTELQNYRRHARATLNAALDAWPAFLTTQSTLTVGGRRRGAGPPWPAPEEPAPEEPAPEKPAPEQEAAHD